MLKIGKSLSRTLKKLEIESSSYCVRLFQAEGTDTFQRCPVCTWCLRGSRKGLCFFCVL